MLKIRLYILFAVPSALFADRWLVLPPRMELAGTEAISGSEKTAAQASDLARAMVLWLRVSRLSQVVPVQEAEACLKQSGLSMEQRIQPNALGRIARHCNAERMLLTRIRRRGGEFEITSKVYFREADSLSDTLVKSGGDLNAIIGEQLAERFGKQPATPRENSRDLIIAGDTYGGVYFDWQQLKPLFLSLDSVKTAYCLVDHNGKLQSYKLKADKNAEKEFLDKLRFEAGGALLNTAGTTECARAAAQQSAAEGRRAITVFLVSAQPADQNARVTLKSALRKLSTRSKIHVVTAGTAAEDTGRFWAGIVRELGENALFLPSAQRARAGLSNGQEWYVFRRGGRLYESRSAEPQQLQSGILVPEKYADRSAPQDLLKLYAGLSGNKVVSEGSAEVWNAPLKRTLTAAFKLAGNTNEAWRVMLEQNGQVYHLSLVPAEARKLKVGEFARIYTELLPPSERELVRNRPSPAMILDNAALSSVALELNMQEYLQNPAKYLRRGLGGRSFYVLTGKVLRVSPPEADALDDGF